MGDVVVGVVSFNFAGTVCGQPDVPGVYSRVTSYLDWIEQNANAPEITGNEVKRVFTEQNPLLWRGQYQNYPVGLPISHYGFNAVPTVSSPLWRGYQIFSPVYGQNYWPLRG